MQADELSRDAENAMLMTDLFYLIPVAIALALVIAGLGAWMWLRTSGRYEDLAATDDAEGSDEGRPISKAEAARSTSWLV